VTFFEGKLFNVPGLVASEDLSSKQYHFVKLSGNATVAAVSAVTDRPIGVLQNAPRSGEEAIVMGVGVSRMRVSGTVVPGDVVGVHSDGKALALTPGTDTTAFVAGQCVVGNAGTT